MALTLEAIQKLVPEPLETSETLDLSNKGITSLCSFSTLTALKKLNLSNNPIRFAPDLRKALDAPNLEELDLRGCVIGEAKYLKNIINKACPKLKILNGKPFQHQEEQVKAKSDLTQEQLRMINDDIIDGLKPFPAEARKGNRKILKWLKEDPERIQAMLQTPAMLKVPNMLKLSATQLDDVGRLQPASAAIVMFSHMMRDQSECPDGDVLGHKFCVAIAQPYAPLIQDLMFAATAKVKEEGQKLSEDVSYALNDLVTSGLVALCQFQAYSVFPMDPVLTATLEARVAEGEAKLKQRPQTPPPKPHTSAKIDELKKQIGPAVQNAAHSRSPPNTGSTSVTPSPDKVPSSNQSVRFTDYILPIVGALAVGAAGVGLAVAAQPAAAAIVGSALFKAIFLPGI